jgi:hypothetical protein
MTRSLPVSERQCIGVLCLLVGLPVAMIGCGREGRLPTATTSPKDLVGAAPSLDARDEGMLETMRGRGHQHIPARALVAEAKNALGAVLTWEQVYYQKWGTFTDVPATADFGAILGVSFGDLLRRWELSVSDASVTGFLAKAQGRDQTAAERITVILRYQRGKPLVWRVLHRRHCR